MSMLPKTMSAKQFADKMQVNYRTALRWLSEGLVPGAEYKKTRLGSYWDIPMEGLRMVRLKPGPKSKAKKLVRKKKGIDTKRSKR